MTQQKTDFCLLDTLSHAVKPPRGLVAEACPFTTEAEGQKGIVPGAASIGIDPGRRVRISGRLLLLHDGPLLEQSLKAIAGRMIRVPRSSEHRPDGDRLAARFEQFKRVV